MDWISDPEFIEWIPDPEFHLGYTLLPSARTP